MESHGWMIGLLVLLATANGYIVGPSSTPRLIQIQRYHHEGTSVGHTQSWSSLRSTTEDRIEDEFASFAATLESPSSDRAGTKSTKSWQTDLEQLLVDPKLSMAQRQVLISDLMNANEEIRESVTTAIRERKVCGFL
jgi:hypothetical protein